MFVGKADKLADTEKLRNRGVKFVEKRRDKPVEALVFVSLKVKYQFIDEFQNMTNDAIQKVYIGFIDNKKDAILDYSLFL